MYEFSSDGVTDQPFPHTALQFTVEATNSAGSVESVYSDSVVTDSSGMF